MDFGGIFSEFWVYILFFYKESESEVENAKFGSQEGKIRTTNVKITYASENPTVQKVTTTSEEHPSWKTLDGKHLRERT